MRFLCVPRERLSTFGPSDSLSRPRTENQLPEPVSQFFATGRTDPATLQEKPLVENGVQPLGALARTGDWLLKPLMRSWSPKGELPKESHPWNVRRLKHSSINNIDRTQGVTIEGSNNNKMGRWGFLYEINWFPGSWKDYVLLEVKNDGEVWHVGWLIEGGNKPTVF